MQTVLCEHITRYSESKVIKFGYMVMNILLQ